MSILSTIRGWLGRGYWSRDAYIRREGEISPEEVSETEARLFPDGAPMTDFSADEERPKY